MFISVHRRLATLDGKPRSHRAGFMCAVPVADVHHSVISMFLAVHRVLLPSTANLGLFGQELCKQRLLRMSTMPPSALLLAVRRFPAALDTKRPLRLAGVPQATPVSDVHHAVLSVLLAVRRRLAALEIETCHRPAGVM